MSWSPGDKITAAKLNAIEDQVLNAVTASYTVYKSDATHYYAKANFTDGTNYGGSGNEGGADGTRAAAVIQAAINALTSGGLIFITQGVYEIDTAVTLASDVSLVGEGVDATIIRQTANTDALTVSSTDHAKIQDLTLDTETNNAKACIGGRPVNNFTALNVKFLGGSQIYAVYLSGPTGFEDDIPGNFAAENMSKHNSFINCETYGEYNGDVFSFSFQQSGRIVNCKFYGRVALYVIRECQVNGIVYGTKYQQGVYLTGPAVDNHINMVIMHATTDGLRAQGTATDNMDVMNNDIQVTTYKSGSDGAYLKNAQYNTLKTLSYLDERRGVNLVDSDYNIVEAIIRNCNEGSNGVLGVGSALDGTECKYNTLKLVVFDDRGIQKMSRAVREWATSTGNLYHGGYWGAGVDGTATVGSGSIIRDVANFVTENSGITGAIATGATVAHGLAGTPTAVTVTAAESGPTDIYVSAVGATTFVINYGGGGTKTFYWTAEYVP